MPAKTGVPEQQARSSVFDPRGFFSKKKILRNSLKEVSSIMWHVSRRRYKIPISASVVVQLPQVKSPAFSVPSQSMLREDPYKV